MSKRLNRERGRLENRNKLQVLMESIIIFKKVKGNPVITVSDCGRYEVARHKGTPKKNGEPLTFYSAWFDTKRIGGSVDDIDKCKGICISHKIRNRS